MPVWVVDLSIWDGDVSISKLKAAGVGAVIAKCGGGDAGKYRDPKFEANYANCKAAGMPVGIYWYLNAIKEEDARAEANYCLKLLKGKSFEYPVYVDVEAQGHRNLLEVDPEKLAKIICAFTDVIKDAGYLPGVYSWKWLLEPCGPSVAKLEWWVCSWTRNKPCDCGLWQFGGETNVIRSTYVAGYGPMDQSYAYKDYPAITKGGKKESTMSLSVPEKIAQVAEHFAVHSAHGYSQTNRGTGSAETIKLSDGTTVTISSSDVDCSEMVRQCTNAAITGSYRKPIAYMWTGNQNEEMTSHGFTRIAFSASKVRRGDVLWRNGHTGVALGGGRQAEASSDENGSIYGPRMGDQTGYEVKTASLSSRWTYIYRYNSSSDEADEGSDTAEEGFDVNKTVTVRTDSLNVRDAPSTKTGKVVTSNGKPVRYAKGDTVNIDKVIIGDDGFIWGSYIGASSGKRRYIALGSAELAR